MLNVILDIGANDGSDGLGYALFNPNFTIYAFEPNPELILKINENKSKIEKLFNTKLSNYRITEKAVSNFNGTSDFYLSEFDLCSSLLKYKFVKTKKKIKCEVITLEKFCAEKQIDNIAFLHVDTQGSDLDVLKGLKAYKNIVHEGVVETRLNKENLIYEGSCTLDEVENFFKESSYKIIDKKFNGSNELNVFFKNEKLKDLNKISVKKFNPRFLKRITEDRMKIKDSIYIFFLKKFKKIKN
ncbi:FkbM family methyltransferase [Candidatus Pelagibacter sp.]|nr:FkbM family methyltransferase [Candidatus Pelagibacter sp.]